MITLMKNNSFMILIFSILHLLHANIILFKKNNFCGFYFNDYEVNIEIMMMIITVLINIVIVIHHIVVIPVIILVI